VTKSAGPLDVARAIQNEYGLSTFYLADLDAICGRSPSHALYGQLLGEGFHLCVDAGLQFAAEAEPLITVGVEEIVFGLETVRSPAELASACQHHGDRIVFSLDLRNGEPLGNRAAWNHGDASAVAEQAVAAGARRMIALDLARVGVGTGVGTEDLCRRLAQTHSDVEIIAGGGVRGADDLRRLHDCGIGGVLVASALHDKRITRKQLAEFLH
jgi:phosphoribosylformimino-5-aminoimidazole carboxamide ribotide isomerase